MGGAKEQIAKNPHLVIPGIQKSKTSFISSLLVFSSLFLSYGYITQVLGANQNSRLDLLHALFVHHEIRIDQYAGNTRDKAQFGGHFYSEKAPGGVVIAMPSFAIVIVVYELAGWEVDAPDSWETIGYFTTVFSVGLLTALAGVATFRVFAFWFGEKLAFVATVGLFLGSMPFPYATSLFSHGMVMALLFLALLALLQVRDNRPDFADRLAGFCTGLAVASEYPTTIAAGGLLVFVWYEFGFRTALRFALTAAAPLLLIPAYNLMVTGSPLTLGYGHVPGFEGNKQGFYGISLPNPSVMAQLLFGQYRGLFFWSPFLLLAFFGYPALFRVARPLFWLTLVVPMAFLFFMSGYFYWNGGWALGPRHLSGAVPFLALPAAFRLKKFPRTGAIVTAGSVFLNLMATAVDAMPPDGAQATLTGYIWPWFREGVLAPNLGNLVFGLEGKRSLLPLALVLATLLFLGWLTCRREKTQGKGTFLDKAQNKMGN